MKKVWKITMSNPFLRRKPLNCWPKNRSLWQRNEKQEHCFWKETLEKMLQWKDQVLCGQSSVFFINILIFILGSRVRAFVHLFKKF